MKVLNPGSNCEETVSVCQEQQRDGREQQGGRCERVSHAALPLTVALSHFSYWACISAVFHVDALFQYRTLNYRCIMNTRSLGLHISRFARCVQLYSIVN
jgi:hypothetical protein